MSNLETNLKELLVKLERYRDEYREMKHQDGDKDCEFIYRGKAEAYWFAADELRDLLKWHNILKD